MTITPDQKMSEARSRWSDGRRMLIAQLKKNNFFNKNAAKAPADSSATFVIKNITVYGEKQPILDIAGKFKGTSSGFEGGSNANALSADSLKQSNQPKLVFPLENKQVTSLAAANVPYYTLLPVSGSVVTGLFTAPGVASPTRGVVNYMGWNSNGFATDQTYEHDFFLSADQGTYFAKSFSLPPYCQPKAVYAATSWPSASYPYLDSDLESNGFCSSSGDIAYSIGAAQASAITPSVTHFTAILMPDGDATTDVFLLQGQVGYQSPIGCYNTLCSFAYGYNSGYKETTHYGIIRGAVPSSKSWTFSGFVPDTPVNVSVTNPTSSSLRINFVDITWDETNIVVERQIGSVGSWVPFNFGILNAGNSAGSWYWVNSSLMSHAQYCYRLKATNAIGSSPYSPIMCNTTL